jgi:hypothetical protein
MPERLRSGTSLMMGKMVAVSLMVDVIKNRISTIFDVYQDKAQIRKGSTFYASD